MDSGRAGGADRPRSAASEEVAALQAALGRQAAQLADVRRHALSVVLLPWDSPAGGAFRTYLSERCSELSGTIDLLDAASRDLGDYGDLIRAAEMVQGGAES